MVNKIKFKINFGKSIKLSKKGASKVKKAPKINNLKKLDFCLTLFISDKNKKKNKLKAK